MSTFVSIQAAHRQQAPRQRAGDVPPEYGQALETRLRAEVEGEVRFGSGDRALYATDASNYRQTPIGVVVPATIEDVLATVAACRDFGAPILSRGGGTSLAGQCCNVAVVLDFSKYLHRVTWLDADRRQAAVQPGIVLDDLRQAAEKHHLTFGPDPATHTHCTLGGMIGNNSCGVHALMAGKTSENIDELDILLYDGTRLRVGATSEAELAHIISEGGRRGEIYRKLRDLRDRYEPFIRNGYPNIPRRVSGFNLDKLLPENGFHVAQALVGTEATCVVVLEAVTRLVPSPPVRSLVVLGYADVYLAGDAVKEILQFHPIGLEGFDEMLVRNMRTKGLHPDDIQHLPPGKGWLLVEFGAGTREESEAQARDMMAALEGKTEPPSMRLCRNREEAQVLWGLRESALGATSFVPGQDATWEGWEDAAVPPDRLGDYLRDVQRLYDRYGYFGALYGHFGQGCIHTRINFDLVTQKGIDHWRSYMNEAVDLVVRYGGSLSGEHGDGQARAEFLPKMFSPELMEAFREFKGIWDPDGRMNPGKVIDPYRIDENLRLGTDYRPPAVRTHFQFPDDGGDLNHAVLRCVGVGKCRRHDAGIMCPSYMVTHEEKHSTRGRARLLFEMLSGEVIKEGWQSEEVKEALDLCLACKGCKGQCPVNVDMGTYKAEFLSHYYEEKRRPAHAYAVGWIHRWARLASLFPELANFASNAPVLSQAAKRLLGIHPKRQLPRFARRTFKQWFRHRPKNNVSQNKVILWPDTFTNYWSPEHGSAAVTVLERLGYQVCVPKASLCCGRPLYDHGMLDQARNLLCEIVDTLRPAIRRGMPLVGIEPSCVAVFRDELRNMLPGDADAQHLAANSFTLAEFIEKGNHLEELPSLSATALVHRHCHHESIMTFRADRKVLDQIKVDYRLLDSGCCGLAGGFGYEKEHYDLSVACGERVLLPEIRKASAETLIIADGFSCQSQIKQQAGRKSIHLAQVLEMAYEQQQPAD